VFSLWNDAWKSFIFACFSPFMDELIGSLWAGRGRISCQGRSLMLINLPPFFDHSRHKLVVHRLPIALDVFTV
jgi:hypothetical protein